MSGNIFKVRIEARVKNASLVGARESAGLNCREAAERIGVHYKSYESMRRYPSKNMQNRICDFYRGLGIFLLEEDVFPEELGKTKIRMKYIAEREIPKENLISLDTGDKRLLPPVYVQGQIESFELRRELDISLSKLTPREERIIKMRFYEDMSLEDLAKEFNITRERIRQIEAKALRKLKHPSRSENLEVFLGK